ncbi:MAG: cytochrome c oxidase assembly protein [Chloroflexi bacterium]|nr:cytochrome c oxidase assembly protein [Chloroflexota bacterium]
MLSGPLWAQWGGHPEQLILLALVEGAYLLGVGPLRERYSLSAEPVEPRQMATFTLGVVVIFVALISPIHVLSENYLFSMHMLQHMLLTVVAPPLLILGTPAWLLRPLLRPAWAFRAARAATHPVVAFAVANLVFSLWHIPALYNMTATNELVHAIEHVTMTGTAIMMWWPLASNMPELPRLSYPMQMAYLFLLSLAPTIVFAIVTFASHPIYDFYASAPRIWGLSPLADQQIGGIIMKVGGGAVFLGLLVTVFFRWYAQEERKSKIEAARREYFSE